MPCLTLVVTPCDSVVGHDYVVGPWLGSVVECDYVDGSVVGHDYMLALCLALWLNVITWLAPWLGSVAGCG